MQHIIVQANIIKFPPLIMRIRTTTNKKLFDKLWAQNLYKY